jgi:hypothetical protein
MFSYEMGLFANRFLLSRFGCEKGAVVPARKVGEQREAAEERVVGDLASRESRSQTYRGHCNSRLPAVQPMQGECKTTVWRGTAG